MANSFENPYKKNIVTKKDLEKYDRKYDRREFLKKTAVLTAGGAAVGLGINKILPDDVKGTIMMEPENTQPASPDIGKKNIQTEKITAAREQEEIYLQDKAAIQEQIGYDKKGEISLDSRAMVNYWKDQYHKFPGKLNSSFYEMGAWDEALLKIFREEGVPEKYIYLAIPESNFNLQAVSNKTPKGPYQVTSDTAKIDLP